MSKKKERDRNVTDHGRQPQVAVGGEEPARGRSAKLRRLALRVLLPTAACLLLIVAIFAKNGWFPASDNLSGKRTGWFGNPVAKNAPSSWNPIAMPTATPTPQLSKSYIYAGSRLLAVEDANSVPVPPTDLAVWRPSNGYFYVLGGPGSAQTYYGWGMDHDIPVPGDYDGDGKTDFAIARPAGGTYSWYIAYSSGSYTNFNYPDTGTASDVPVVADYDGDGKSDAAVWRPSNGTWYIHASSGASLGTAWGASTDVPAPADFDGDGKADVAVWRPSNHTYYSINSSNLASNQTFSFVDKGDKPVPGDYDGDGKADFAVFWNSNNSWYIKQSSNGQVVGPIPYGASTDIFVQNDYDGDGKLDIAVWRPSTGVWWIRQSHDLSTRNETWGMNLDIPVPAYYRR